MQAARSPLIDIAKGLGIVLVVLGHSPVVRSWGMPYWMIFSFHMPLFFVLSGALLKPTDGIGRFAGARFHAILKPYLVVCACVGLAKWAAGALDAEQALRFVGGTLYGTGSTIVWTPLWYLPHFFIAACTCMLLLKLIARRPSIVALAAALLLIVGVQAIGDFGELPFSADLLPLSVAMMLAGWLLRAHLASMRARPWLGAAALAAFVALHQAFDARVDLNLRVYDSLIICTAQAALGIYLVLAAAAGLRQLPRLARLVGYAGTGSLFILIFHDPLQVRVLAALQARGVSDIAAALLAAAAGVLLPLGLWEAVKRVPLASHLLLPKTPRAPTPSLPAQT